MVIKGMDMEKEVDTKEDIMMVEEVTNLSALTMEITPIDNMIIHILEHS